ncbi:hypothetical protein RAS1_34890 [Phycisphaerae bacterium RAS1]|nr:hypothetical protein RAS1_34890 [Phycisphaerae bacterium RAS1]
MRWNLKRASVRALTAVVSALTAMDAASPARANNTPVVTITVVGSGDSIGNHFRMQEGDKIIKKQTNLLETPSGAYSATVTYEIQLGKTIPANSYRDPVSGAIVELPPGSMVIGDPPGQPPPPGGAGFRICTPMRPPPGIEVPPGTMEYFRPKKGARVNIGGTITQDTAMGGAPEGIFRDIKDYFAALDPPTQDVQLSLAPTVFTWYELSADPAAAGLVQSILVAEGLAGTPNLTFWASELGTTDGQSVPVYSWTNAPEPGSAVLMLVGALLWRRGRA